MSGKVRLDVDGAIATITNDNPEKKNAFTDDMDAQLFAILSELRQRRDVRAIIWRGDGTAWSSGRDVGSIGNSACRSTAGPSVGLFSARCSVTSASRQKVPDSCCRK